MMNALAPEDNKMNLFKQVIDDEFFT